MPEARSIRRRWGYTRGRRIRNFNPRVRRMLYASIEAGLPYNRACEICGVNYPNFQYWMRRGRTDPEISPYTQFRRYIKRIEARKESELLQVIDRAAEGGAAVREREITFSPDKGRTIRIRKKVLLPNWKAAAWRLERKFPDEYYLQDKDESSRTPDQIAEDIREAYDTLENSIPMVDE